MTGTSISLLTKPPLSDVKLLLPRRGLRNGRTGALVASVSCRSHEAAQRDPGASGGAAGSAREAQTDTVSAGEWARRVPRSELGAPQGRRKRGERKTEEELRKEVSVIMIQLHTLEEGGDRKLHHVFRKYARVFGSDAVMGALCEIIRRQNVDQALEAFEAVRASHWYTPDPEIYASLIRLLARHKRTREAEALFLAMPEHQCPRSTQACTALLEAYANRGDIFHSRKLLEEMKRDPVSFPDSAAYSAVMRGYGRRGLVAEAEALLGEMLAIEVQPDAVAYNVVLEGYARQGHVAKLKEIYARLDAANLEPDLFTFNALLRGFARGGQLLEMEAVFVSMQEQHSVAPNNQSYHCLVEGYALWDNFEKLMRTLHYMLLLRYRPGAATWNVAIGSLSAAGRVRDMEHAYALMKKQRVRPTPLTFLHLVCAYESAAAALRSVEPREAQAQTSAPASEHTEAESPAGVLGSQEAEAATVAVSVTERGGREAAATAARGPEPGGHRHEPAGSASARASNSEGLSMQPAQPRLSPPGAVEPGPAAAGRTDRAPAMALGVPGQRVLPDSVPVPSQAHPGAPDSGQSAGGAGQGLLSADAIKRKIGAVLRQFEEQCSGGDPRVYRAALSAYSALGASAEISRLVAKIKRQS